MENKSNVTNSSPPPRYEVGSLYSHSLRFRINTVPQKTWWLRDFRFPLWRQWDLRSSGMLRNKVIVICRRFGTSRSHLLGLTLQFGTRQSTGPILLEPIGCPETSVNSYKTTLPNVPEKPWFIGKILITDAGSYPRIRVSNTSLWNCHVLYSSLHFTAQHNNLRLFLRQYSFLKMTRGTNLMQELWFIIINDSTCFGHLYVHLQESRLCTAACGVQH